MRTPTTVLAAVVAAAVVAAAVVAACGSTTSTPTGPFSPASGHISPATALPSTTTTTVPVDERTPAQKQVDDLAATLGYAEVSYPHKRPHQEIEATCRAMTESNQLAYPPATWLVGTFLSAKNRQQIIDLYRGGFGLMCPQHVATVDAALTGAAPVESGTQEIGAELGKMKPGKWRNLNAVDDCYWERTAPNGAILANDFLTHAQAHKVIVTIRPSDGSFTSRGCGIWERVG